MNGKSGQPSAGTNERTNERTSEQTNKRINEQTNQRMNERTNERTTNDERTNERTNDKKREKDGREGKTEKNKANTLHFYSRVRLLRTLELDQKTKRQKVQKTKRLNII